jgi:hypothetical protein
MNEAATKAPHPEPAKTSHGEPAKGGAVKLKPVKSEPKDDGDEAAEGKPTLKQKMLATALSRAIVIAALIGSLAYASASLFATRYSLMPAPNTNNNFVYRIDRLTGAVQFCGQQQCTALSSVEK